ncbi:hypothetical protein M011DRAFT_397650 [Sporormia fimetaria CBS 119925]|uniref:DUF218 domain-containing protein n=1 Tax=Sporormia fimetaria CBS 119925 TaxID=1340428 RepID=A0A6A6VHW2_9PLEO|nr:hypothetical protein M011DRAFT_397650 [Sporormia fimetaria CBS 119925]
MSTSLEQWFGTDNPLCEHDGDYYRRGRIGRIWAPNYPGVDTLVIVCCHAIFKIDPARPGPAGYSDPDSFDETNWHLSPFQKSNPETGKPGEHETFLAHIAAGLDALAAGSLENKSLLVFSGGPTKPSLTQVSEARSYYHAAYDYEARMPQPRNNRAELLLSEGSLLMEERATDSFQNLLFSILLFRRTTGRLPADVRVITHAFKSRRFLYLHAPAINWPANRIRVHGIDPPMSAPDYEATLAGELKYGYNAWKHDPFGAGEELSRKRIQRGWKDEYIEELGNGQCEFAKTLLRRMVPSTDHVRQQ